MRQLGQHLKNILTKQVYLTKGIRFIASDTLLPVNFYLQECLLSPYNT